MAAVFPNAFAARRLALVSRLRSLLVAMGIAAIPMTSAGGEEATPPARPPRVQVPPRPADPPIEMHADAEALDPSTWPVQTETDCAQPRFGLGLRWFTPSEDAPRSFR
jgi:hypothetical protein